MPKKWGEKTLETIFQKHTNSAKKSWEKSSEKSAKNVFLYSHEYRPEKMGEKRPKQFFQKHTNSAVKKY